MKRNILLCTLGTTWAVIPEVLGFLDPAGLPLYRQHPDAEALARQRAEAGLLPPDEIWVCTTLGAATGPGLATLQDWCRLLPTPPVLRIWQADETDELASQAECDSFRELLLRVSLLAHEQAGGGQVVMSLAGGRKTMSADMQWAGSLLGCQALIHVVGLSTLQEALRQASPQLLSTAMAADLAGCIVPVIAGDGRRSELLDVDLDGLGPVNVARFPIPLAPPRSPLVWTAPADGWLGAELRRREQAGSQLLGNYLEALGRTERHENWRSLYRLPPGLIETLRRTPLGPALRDWLVELPKADLHRHLGGCLSLADQRAVGRGIWASLSTTEQDRALARVEALLQQVDWEWDWPRRIGSGGDRAHAAAALLVAATDTQLQRNLYVVTEPRLALNRSHRGFPAYERPGELSGSALLGHPAALRPYAQAIVRQTVAEGLAYLELRGSPQKYGEGLAFLGSFHAALAEALGELPAGERPLIRFIVIADRRQTEGVREVIDLTLRARQEWPDFVAGLDLAGDEALTPPAALAEDFLPAVEQCLPLTIHAGEGRAAEAIWQAAYHLHADRIGHGLSLGEHPPLAARFRDRGICLELCPTSNREVVGYRDPDWPATAGFPEFPLRTLWEAGLPLTLCTDNPGISRTTLADEYLTAARMADGLPVWEVLAMLKQGFAHAFLPSPERESLMKSVDARIYRAVLKRFAAGQGAAA